MFMNDASIYDSDFLTPQMAYHSKSNMQTDINKHVLNPILISISYAKCLEIMVNLILQ